MSPTAASPAPAGKASGSTWSRDFTASIVVFLVAMPLCMGIAIASGVPAEKGLITGIIGGIVVGALSGSPLQVSGPAAGLAVLVYEIVQKQGLSALGPILLLAGVIQAVAGVLRLGQWFRAISPAVVHGMLAGIGALIVLGQFHVLMDNSPRENGLANLLAIPEAFISLTPTLGQTEAALAVGIATIAVMMGWEKLRPAKLKLVPGALLGVLAGTAVSLLFTVDVKRIEVPASLFASLAPPSAADLSRLADPQIILSGLIIAFIASAETLLSAAAVDRMHNGVRAKYNKELTAQGVGNALCGLVGALPMTGVIVRSSANVQAGAATRKSAILHGVWILAFVALLPGVLRQVPMAALAGVLVVTGWRLVSLKHVRHLFQQYGILPAAIWAGTFVMVIAHDLLTGVLVGLGLSVLELLPHLTRLGLKIRREPAASNEEVPHLALEGSATFVQLPKLAQALESLPAGAVRLNLKAVSYVDHTCAELIDDWLARRRAAGDRIELDAGDAVRNRPFAVAA